MADWKTLGFFVVFIAVCFAQIDPKPKSKATSGESFYFYVNIYSGVPNPNWTLSEDSIENSNLSFKRKQKARDVIRDLKLMDMHDHSNGHGAHGGQKAKTNDFIKMGYSKIDITHFYADGRNHTMEIKKCSDPYFEWDILTTSPANPTNTRALTTIRAMLIQCLKKQKTAAPASKTPTKPSKTDTHAHAHHDGHAH